MEVELRQQVANSFAGKHLKSLLTTKMVKDSLADAQSDVNKLVEAGRKEARKYLAKQVGEIKKRNWSEEVELNEKFKNKICQKMRKAAEDEIPLDTIVEKLNERTEYLKDHFDQRVQKTVREYMDDGFKKAVDAEVQRIISNAFDIGRERNDKSRVVLVDPPTPSTESA